METQELIEALMSGKKMTAQESDTRLGWWCEYDEYYIRVGRSPFRYITTYGVNEPMEEDIWDYKDWVEVKQKPKWRLPTVEEILTVFNYSIESSTANINGFKVEPYWVDTTNANYSRFVYYLDFDYSKSDLNDKHGTRYVSCVLSDSDELVWSKSSDEKMTWEEAIEYAKNLEE